MRNRAYFLAGLVLALALVALQGRNPSNAEEVAAGRVGQVVKDFSLPDVHGQIHDLADHQGKIIVLAFLGTECPLAKLYALRFQELSEQYADQGVAFLAVDANLQDSLAEMAAFARGARLQLPFLKDNNNVVADALGAERTPEVFLIDRDRVVRYWGRIDDQYGFKSGAGTGYARTKQTEQYLVAALTEVLAGKPVSRPAVKSEGCLIGRVAKVTPQGKITYADQIARILQKRCLTCHRVGEAAPFAMDSYDEVVGWSAMIREVVANERMPPWFADPKYGHFRNDPRLSPEEKQQILAWVDDGCPRGEERDLPSPLQFAEGWQMGEPDEVIYMRAEPFEVPAVGFVEYQYFTVDPGWETDRWIQATEVRPGNRAVVHHVRVYVEPQRVTDPFPRDGIGWYSPGLTPTACPAETAIYVPAHAKIEFQVHYTPIGTPQQDRTMIGIRFADPRTVKKMVHNPTIDYRDFDIPAGDPNYRVYAYHDFPRDTYILSLLPHMHTRGKDFLFEAVYPDGRHEILLHVPHYDFNWQLSYTLAEPKLLPKGSKLYCLGHFDNSADNPANPDPTKVVTWGQQSWDEMLEGIYTAIEAGPDASCAALVALSLTESEKTTPDSVPAAATKSAAAP